MQIVGVDRHDDDGSGVETIDIWFSERRRTWVVERIGADGRQVGPAYCSLDEAQAEACLEEWLRTHTETHVTAAHRATATEKRLLATARRRAA